MQHTSKPRICIVTSSFPRWENDDQGTFVFETAKALAKQGAYVRVIAPHAPGASTRQDMHGVEVIRPRYAWPEKLEVLRKYRAGLPVILRKTNLAWALIPMFMLSQFLALLRHSKDIDVIHANWTLSAFSAVLVKFFRKLPVVVTVQGSDIYETRRIKWLRWITKAVLSRTDQIIALSRSLAELTHQLGVEQHKISVKPNGVDVNYFTPPEFEKENEILFVGSMIHRKGVHILMEAAPIILASIPTFKIIFIGEGPLETQLHTAIERESLSGQVQLLGVQPPKKVRVWMRKAKLFVLPSLEEGLGVVLLEALACGTPCVASDVDGIPDIINRDVGRLVQPGDHLALSEAIISILRDDETWQELHRNTRPYVVSQFSWERITAELLEIYDEIIPD